MSKATFGLTPKEHKQLKNLEKENTRNHMNQLELMFTTLGEVSAKTITGGRDAQGFDENKEAAMDGGTIAGDALKALEKKSGKKVVSKENYLIEPEDLRKYTLKDGITPYVASTA